MCDLLAMSCLFHLHGGAPTLNIQVTSAPQIIYKSSVAAPADMQLQSCKTYTAGKSMRHTVLCCAVLCCAVLWLGCHIPSTETSGAKPVYLVALNTDHMTWHTVALNLSSSRSLCPVQQLVSVSSTAHANAGTRACLFQEEVHAPLPPEPGHLSCCDAA